MVDKLIINMTEKLLENYYMNEPGPYYFFCFDTLVVFLQ